MNSHDITIAGYLAFLAAAAVLQVLAVWTRARVPALGEVFRWAMRTRTARIGVLVAWAWAGLHFFAR